MSRPRVGVAAFLHESNTFVTDPTPLASFEQEWLLEGDRLLTELAGIPHEVGGFLAGLDDAGLAAVPLLAARAIPSGPVAGAAFDQLLTRLQRLIADAPPLDGVLAAPHGATVSERAADADGEWLRRLRGWVGERLPIVATLDLHANLSRQMVDYCDALIPYRSNPHLDQRQRGEEAAALLAATLRGEVRPVLAAAFPPMAINIERQHTGESPMQELYEVASQLGDRVGVLGCSLLHGFPYADVPEMGSAVCVTSDGDQELAGDVAREFAAYLWSERARFVGEFDAPEAVVSELASHAGPVCLLDMGDNVGGGSPGDGTTLAHAIHRRRLSNCFVCLYDVEAVAAAKRAGRGSTLKLAVGGHTDDLHGAPLEANFEVVSLHDGRFEEPEARHGGVSHFDMGATAVLRTDAGLIVMVTSRRVFPVSLGQLTSCDINPRALHLIVAKGVVAPVTAYSQVCRELVRVDTPGSTSANMERLEYRNRRRPMFPFERDLDWTAEAYLGARATRPKSSPTPGL